ncbi:MAG: ABC transporter permease [Clostridia bacterium]|nr:ABC transporter permease [Clostridia bacterium]
MSKDYAGISINKDYKFVIDEGYDFPLSAQAQFVQAANKEDEVFSSLDIAYSQKKLAEDVHLIYGLQQVASATALGGNYAIELEDSTLNADFSAAFSDAISEGAAFFEFGGNEYVVSQERKNYTAGVLQPVALALKNIYDYASPETSNNLDFCMKSEIAFAEIASGGAAVQEFTSGGVKYQMTVENDRAIISEVKGDELIEYANASRYLVQPIYADVFFTLEFKTKVIELVEAGVEEFTYDHIDGKLGTYTLHRSNDVWSMKWIEETRVLDTFSFPDSVHPLGTDGNGMDVLTRLMYGGRISLIIGFIVVIIETFIGVVLGGIAGYFGKFVDNLIMRIVDIFNSIPSLPLLIILGAMMDAQRVDPMVRMMYLMIILGVLGWPGIARLVRGQILSLREQEFMIAAEATGISVSKRIFKHLVPNVMPQLIVISTLSLGGVILTESVISFLGLGVKFPFASWGNIINAVSNVYVMTNYLFVWIPAGFCILITVLGFNFIGDGLRDAFDPKMKR